MGKIVSFAVCDETRNAAARARTGYFVCRQRPTASFQKTYLDGAADLAIEIISPESIGRDRGEKFVEYEAAGIREYWLIDPERRQAEFYRLEFRRILSTDFHARRRFSIGSFARIFSCASNGFGRKLCRRFTP
ncbi:MAG: Uma2 family endonuclease [Nocardioidaceae bacterium]